MSTIYKMNQVPLFQKSIITKGKENSPSASALTKYDVIVFKVIHYVGLVYIHHSRRIMPLRCRTLLFRSSLGFRIFHEEVFRNTMREWQSFDSILIHHRVRYLLNLRCGICNLFHHRVVYRLFRMM
jgi:hypothetical protein